MKGWYTKRSFQGNYLFKTYALRNKANQRTKERERAREKERKRKRKRKREREKEK